MRSTVAWPTSLNITMSTSSRDHTRYTKKLMHFPKARSCSRSCSSHSPGRTPMARGRSLRDGVISLALSTAPTAAVKAKEECAFCHIASAKKDQVGTQFYRVLDY